MSAVAESKKWTLYTLAYTILSKSRKGERKGKMTNARFKRDVLKCREDHRMPVK